MIIYKNVDYGINAYRISLFKLKFECVGEIIWRPFDLVPSECHLEIFRFHVVEEYRE